MKTLGFMAFAAITAGVGFMLGNAIINGVKAKINPTTTTS